MRGAGREIASPRICRARKMSCYHAFMNTLESLSNRQLLDATRALANRACQVEADLLVHLAEIDERRLYLESTFPSLFAFASASSVFPKMPHIAESSSRAPRAGCRR